MTITSFDTGKDLMIVGARVSGRSGHRRLALAIDTGATATVISPDIVEDIGYSRHDRHAVTTIRSAIGKEHGYLLRVARFVALGFAFSEFEVNVFELAAGYGIDGVIGLNFLRRFDYEIRSVVGRIGVRPASLVAPPA